MSGFNSCSFWWKFKIRSLMKRNRFLKLENITSVCAELRLYRVFCLPHEIILILFFSERSNSTVIKELSAMPL